MVLMLDGNKVQSIKHRGLDRKAQYRETSFTAPAVKGTRL